MIPRNPDVRLKAIVDRARLYDKVISSQQPRSLYEGTDFVSQDELIDAMSPKARTVAKSLLAESAHATKALAELPLPADARSLAGAARKKFESEFVKKMNGRFRRVDASNSRYGGIITNAAVLTMTSAPTHTQPIARGVWLTEVIFNNPPPPPPNNIPTLDESVADKSLTIRERFARHRSDPDCAACHARIDPLGFALENYDVVGRWRDRYPSDRPLDPSGTLLKSHKFQDVAEFKHALVKERSRFARGFTAHFARFFAARELSAKDAEINKGLDEIEELKAVIEKQKASLQEQAEQISALKAPQNDAKRTEQLNRELNSRLNKLQDELDSQKKRNKVMQKEAQADKAALKDYQQFDVKKMKKNLDANKKKAAEQNAAIELLQKTNNKLKVENKELSAKVKDFEEKAASEDSGADTDSKETQAA